MSQIRDIVRPSQAPGVAFEDEAYSGVFDPARRVPSAVFGEMTHGRSLAVIYRDGKPREDKGINCFCADPAIPSTPPGSAYTGIGYSAGHLWPARYALYDPSGQALASTFYTRNVAPMRQGLNGGAWLKLENSVFEAAENNRDLAVCAGPTFLPGDRRAANRLAIPSGFYKIIADPQAGRFECHAMANFNGAVDHVVSLETLERWTGILWPALGKLSEGSVFPAPQPRALSGELILNNGIIEAEFLKRFPDKYDVRALTPWESKRLGLDWTVQQWVFLADFRYYSDRYGWIVIPKGFTTDFASVPARLQSVISACSPHILFGSAPHDRLFVLCGLIETNGKRLTFEQVNELLVEAMWYLGATSAERAAVYTAVQIGGKSTWNSHNPPEGFKA